jgi:hypothetical protein
VLGGARLLGSPSILLAEKAVNARKKPKESRVSSKKS